MFVYRRVTTYKNWIILQADPPKNDPMSTSVAKALAPMMLELARARWELNKRTPWEVGKKEHFPQVSKKMNIDELMYPKHYFMWVDVERLRCVT